MESRGLTCEIAAFVAGGSDVALSAEVGRAAKRAFIDTIGVILAGRNEAVVTKMQALLPEGGEAFAWPGSRMLGARDAALLNGLAGHVLDYDDVAQAGHPSVVLVPAIVAEAQRLGASGRAALAAYAMGYEVWCELSGREAEAYHLGSWHPTAMIGIVAATAATAALNRLDAARASNALAIAASMASGVIANFGSDTKPLQAGLAAAKALEAVRYAAAGVTGAADALEGEHGLLRGISPGGKVDCDAPARLDRDCRHLLEQGLSVKRYPVCYASHRAIDAVIALAQQHDLVPGQVSKVTVSLGPAPAQTLRYAAPHDGLEARFSLHHNMAAALVDRVVGFAQLSDSFVTRADVAALYALTEMDVVAADCPEQPGMAKFDSVTIATHDGRQLGSGPIRHAMGHASNPLSDAALDAKFLDCARHGGAANADMLLGHLHRLEHLENLKELGQ